VNLQVGGSDKDRKEAYIWQKQGGRQRAAVLRGSKPRNQKVCCQPAEPIKSERQSMAGIGKRRRRVSAVQVHLLW